MSDSNLKNDYLNTVIPKLQDEFQYKNKHQIPKLVKITLNAGLGLNGQNRTYLQKLRTNLEQFRDNTNSNTGYKISCWI